MAMQCLGELERNISIMKTDAAMNRSLLRRERIQLGVGTTVMGFQMADFVLVALVAWSVVILATL